MRFIVAVNRTIQLSVAGNVREGIALYLLAPAGLGTAGQRARLAARARARSVAAR